ncbi:MAG: dTDP-4-dehydrorhamnose 3,5-epimerase [Burkholderiales bacterium]
MRFVPTPLAGSYLIEPEPVSDERGFFARTFCRDEFAAHGLDPSLVQCNISFNRKKGTLRGMHFQKAPHEEAKVVRCTQGKIYDVMVDLRPESGTFRKWFGAELSAENRLALYIPAGFAHGFLTLADDAEVLYQMSEFFHPECASGVRWNDPAFSIDWPEKAAVISERDAGYPDFGGAFP